MSKINHTFVIPAYKNSKHLEECIKSLMDQSLKSNIIISTSTPSDFIRKIAKKYKIPVVENSAGAKGIGYDFDFALSCSKTKYTTIVHQDDLYDKNYLKEVFTYLEKYKDVLIVFTDYYELREKKVIKSNKILKIKRLLLLPLQVKLFSKNRFVRRRILSLGCPICCPSVTFNMEKIKLPFFSSKYCSNVDWQAWEKLSREKGSFVYIRKPLMSHRVHRHSATTRILCENKRCEEDLEMFEKFWPKRMAKKLAKSYAQAEESNRL
jgi:glycosyltransferase involved in cell wall biosynthesis